MRRVLTIAIIQLAIADRCCAASGMIWRKRDQRFVQLSAIPQFAALQEQRAAELRATESLDMRNETIKAVFFEEKNMVMFRDNDTKINGICGELWYFLADYLNFTFIPIKTTNELGGMLENGTYYGMIEMLARNEAQVILRSGFFKDRLDFIDYTVPFYRTRFHIYAVPQRLFDNKWVFTLFSPRTWYFVVLLYAVLSGVGYLLEKIPRRRKRKRKGSVGFTLSDHFFFSFAIMCGQGYVPDAYLQKFKILSLSKSVFAWLLLLAFSSNLIYRMANRQIILPFKDLDTLFNNTKYIVLVYHTFYNYFQENYRAESAADKSTITRVRFVDTVNDAHDKVCSDMDKYVMFELEDRFMAMKRSGCPLRPTGNYNETWITFIVKKHFRYKRTINSALIKINEVGLLDALRDRWLDIRSEDKEQTEFKTIDTHQVYLIFLILYCGTIISLVILVAENITYHYETQNAPRKRRKRRNLKSLTNCFS